MVDYSADLYNPVYALIGVPATMTVGTAGEIALTVIDDVRSKSNTTSGASGGVEVRSVEAACFARVPELIQNGVSPSDYRGSVITFNGRSWVVRSHDQRGSPNGEDLGEVRFLLKAADGGTSGGGGAYVAKAVHFDGSTLLSCAALTATDTVYLSCSFWVKCDNLSLGPSVWVTDPNNNYGSYVALRADGSVRAEVSDTNDNNSFNYDTDVNTAMQDVWQHVVISQRVDTPSTSGYFGAMYVNDVFIPIFNSPVYDAFLIGTNGLSLMVGGDPYGDNLSGDLADLLIMPGVNLLDGSNLAIAESTRRLFIDTNSKPVDPSVATGTLGVPVVLLSGDATTFATNKGTGGVFTVTGALTDAGTSPSG